jgi:hypothetical protein
MAERSTQATATPPGATPAPGHPDARLEAIASAPDPMLAAFGGMQRTPEEDEQPPADDATPPDEGHPAPEPQPEPSEPSGPTVPDFDTASPDELRAWARQHPQMAKALGLEVRDHIQRQQVRLQQEQQARQQAEQQAEQARAHAERVGAFYEAFYDEDNPLHLDALRFFGQQGVQPIEVQKVLNSPIVSQHVSAYAQQVAAAAMEQATADAIRAAAAFPTFKALDGEALEAAWQASDGSVPDFYEQSFRKAGWLDPAGAAEFRKAAQEEARTKVFGEYPPADGSLVGATASRSNGTPIPADPSQIDPTEWFTRAFTPRGGS